MRSRFLLVVATSLLVGCTVAPSAAPASVAPSPVPSSPILTPTAPISSEASHRLVVAGPVALTIPAAWFQRTGGINPSGNFPLLFVGPDELSSECQGNTCFAWPQVQLGPGSLMIAIRLYANPGFTPPSGGDPITVSGLAAHRITGGADAGCLGIGGTRLVQVWLPKIAGTSGFVSIDACISGASSAADAEFAAILATTVA